MPTAFRNPLFALLTDFGQSDAYVGVVKGVILSRCPTARFVDISHEIDPGEIRQGGYVLWSAYRYFPPRTIFLAVVDPGVGTKRRIIALETDQHLFLAPDNGLLDSVRADAPVKRIIELDDSFIRSAALHPTSRTFHGRDILAPAACAIANGIPLGSMGKRIVPRPVPVMFADGPRSGVRPMILHIDRFGNVITNIRLQEGRAEKLKALRIGRTQVRAWNETFASAQTRRPGLIIGSSGLVEIVVKGGSAAKLLRAALHSRVEAVWE